MIRPADYFFLTLIVMEFGTIVLGEGDKTNTGSSVNITKTSRKAVGKDCVQEIILTTPTINGKFDIPCKDIDQMKLVVKDTTFAFGNPHQHTMALFSNMPKIVVMLEANGEFCTTHTYQDGNLSKSTRDTCDIADMVAEFIEKFELTNTQELTKQ